MAFKVKSFKELISMTNEMLDSAMVPMRVRAAKAKAEMVKIKLEEQLITLEAKINELCAKKEPNFEEIADRMDEYDLAERRLKQITNIVNQMFPES